MMLLENNYNLKENKIKTLRKIPAIKSGFENIFRKSVLKP